MPSSDGMGINAAARTFKVAKNTIYGWLERLANMKETLMLYALCHQFLSMLVEGDELYTKVKENKPPEQSEGWTIVLMDRASRFIWEMKCGPRERSLFQSAIETLSLVIEQTQDLRLVTDGERRYGNILFEICRQALRTGRVGRPRQTLPKGIKVRVKKPRAIKAQQTRAPTHRAKRPQNTRSTAGNIPIPRRIWMMQTSTPIIWKASMQVYGASCPAIGGVLTTYAKRQPREFDKPSRRMFIG